MRKKIVAGNWKMNKTYQEGIDLLNEIETLLHHQPAKTARVIIAPPYIHLSKFSEILKNSKIIEIAAQNCSSYENGAYTGEISASIIKSTGAGYIIIGHSERRHYFNETNKVLAEKINLSIKNDLIPIYCCGESLLEKEASRGAEIVKSQITEGLFHLDSTDFSKVIIAYEPVWAIGTGVTATPGQAQEMHAYIRSLIQQKYDKKTAENITIIYGGSCNPSNAVELFECPDVDGGLIGGASLKASDFVAIANSF